MPVVNAFNLQQCCSAQLIIVRHKAKPTSPFPKERTNLKLFDDLEKEFGGAPPGRNRNSKFAGNALPFIPVAHPLIIDTVGKVLILYIFLSFSSSNQSLQPY